MQRRHLWLVIAITVLGLDQLSKFLVLDRLTTAFDGARAGQQSRLSTFFAAPPVPDFDHYHWRPTTWAVVSTDFFRLRYAENTGAAFGIFRGLPEGLRLPFFHLITLSAVGLMLFYFLKLKGTERLALVGLPLILGGALGNYSDRLVHGFVIDFFEAHWFEQAWWPAFNVADIAICVGVGLLVVDSLRRRDVGADRALA